MTTTDQTIDRQQTPKRAFVVPTVERLEKLPEITFQMDPDSSIPGGP